MEPRMFEANSNRDVTMKTCDFTIKSIDVQASKIKMCPMNNGFAWDLMGVTGIPPDSCEESAYLKQREWTISSLFVTHQFSSCVDFDVLPFYGVHLEHLENHVGKLGSIQLSNE